MAGYFGYSMSNNAVEAYENGSKPFSKWTKADILELIEDENLELNCSIDKLKKVPVKIDRHKQAFENWSEGEPVKVWFDSDNNLCIEYESGNWWHYNENCEWW